MAKIQESVSHICTE
jgi:methyl coenzyme M reductase subunit C-like uncharacterized protein (methanogenesis marker protein 7)